MLKDGFLKRIMDEFLVPSVINMDYDSLLNVLLYKLSQVLGSFRYTYADNQILNYYGLMFGGSGIGKDLGLVLLDNFLLAQYKVMWADKVKQDYLEIIKAIEYHAVNKFKGEGAKTEKQRKEFIEKELERVRDIEPELDLDGTFQGIIADATELSKRKFGGLNILVSELSQYFASMKPEEKRIFKVLLGLYTGNIKPSTLKSETKKINVKNIFCNLLMFCAPKILLIEQHKKNFLDLMETGFCRRCSITFVPDRPRIPYDREARRPYEEHAFTKLMPIMTSKILTLSITLQKNIKISQAAILVLRQYNIKVTNELNEKRHYLDETVKAEMGDRYLRAEKIACIIAAFEHPESLIVTADDMEQATRIVEKFSTYLEIFIKAKPEDELDKFYKYFLMNKNIWISKTELRTTKIIANASKFSKDINTIIEALQERAEIEGYTLIEEKAAKGKGISYKLVESNIGKPLSSDVKSIDELVGI